jgi:glycine cleavage system pyridoxal-binding protein P
MQMRGLLQSRHIGVSEQDEEVMLQVIGANSFDELIN